MDNFDDAANKWLRAQIQSLERNTRRGRRGKESDIDRDNLLKRYAELLSIAKRVHSAASRVVEQFNAKVWRIPADEKVTRIRAGIWDEVKDLYGKRVAHLILSGEAFQLISTEEYTSGSQRNVGSFDTARFW